MENSVIKETKTYKYLLVGMIAFGFLGLEF